MRLKRRAGCEYADDDDDLDGQAIQDMLDLFG